MNDKIAATIIKRVMKSGEEKTIPYVYNNETYVTDHRRIHRFINVSYNDKVIQVGQKSDIPCIKAIGWYDESICDLELPKLSDLKTYIRQAKSHIKHQREEAGYNPLTRGKKVRVLFNFGEELPLVNAEYLRDMIEHIPNGKCSLMKFYNKEPKDYNCAIRMIDNIGNYVLLLPVRKDNLQAYDNIRTDIRKCVSEDRGYLYNIY